MNIDKYSFVTIDPALNEYREKVMFPKKPELANRILKTASATTTISVMAK